MIISIFLAPINSFALDVPLYPEDGSMRMKNWYYSGGNAGPKFNPKTITDIEDAFQSEGVIATQWPAYPWMQDILFFDQEGNFVELPNIPPYEEYFSDVTLGIFESFGEFTGELTRLNANDFRQNPIKKVNGLSVTFLEGGATITGKFKDGSDYIILTESRLENIKRAYGSLKTTEETINVVASDLGIKKENIILISKKVGTEHLDLYMKALPGGVILLDDPHSRLETAKEWLVPLEVINQVDAYENGNVYLYKKKTYKKKIKLVKEMLDKRFEVHLISGRYFQYYTNVNGVTYAKEHINFFNGVAGLNNNGEKFYITNKAPGAPELQNHWKSVLQRYGYKGHHVHFPGEYSNGSGLDCMGSPSI